MRGSREPQTARRMAKTPPQASRDWRRRLGQSAARLAEHAPGLVAVFGAPGLVEAGRDQFVAERRGVDLVEFHAEALQRLARLGVEFFGVDALVDDRPV